MHRGVPRHPARAAEPQVQRITVGTRRFSDEVLRDTAQQQGHDNDECIGYTTQSSSECDREEERGGGEQSLANSHDMAGTDSCRLDGFPPPTARP